ncbi:Multidrug resistance protein 3 [Baekduia alba]|uniref:MFS transporter n=1 Tax=Baekduia alba TaxID=2997333 RepID=UPI00234243B5|nr:MFS transporter [Baekduia alba]WCB94307.1 Multidrug resistance protein 3 [Baekduia alba]
MRSLLILSIAALAFALAQTTLIPALGELKSALHTDSSGVAWTLTGYLLAAAVFTPLFGRLGDMFGKRRLLVISLMFFTAGSVVAALGSSLGVIVAGRVLQGVGGGIFPLCFGIIRDEFPRERVGQSIGLISATLGIGGGLGLVIGGVLVDNASYHDIFWLSAVMSAVAAVAVQLFIHESPVRQPGKVDLRGAAVLGVGLVLPMVAIARANVWGWTSPKTIVLVLVGLAILALWVGLERRTPEPMADIETLRRPPVLVTNVATVLVGFGMFGTYILIPQLAEASKSTGYGFGLSATAAGVLMLPSALAMLVVGPISGILGARMGNKVPLTLGAFATALGLILMGFMHGSELEILLFNTIASIGIGLAYAAMPNLIVDAVPPARTGEATGFNAVVRSVGSSLGSQVTAAILAGSVIASTGLPSDDGYKVAFLISGASALVAGVAAFLIPTDGGHEHLSVAAEIGAAGLLPDPAFATER